MEEQNSLVSFIADLHSSLVTDVASVYGISENEYKRDILRISSRVQKEGLSFYTKTLPKLGKAVDASLGRGVPFHIQGFERSPERTTPKLFGWLFERVFDGSGFPKPDAVPDDVARLRQLTYTWYKLEVSYAEKLKDKVVQEFIATDNELAHKDLSLCDQRVINHARALIARVCSTVSAKDFNPKHGPGAVSTGEKQWQKMRFKRIYRSLDKYFPVTEYFFGCCGHLCDSLDELQSREVLDSGTAKVVLVPKDSRGPRLISCEPLEYQWVQQAVAQPLVKAIERHPFTRGHVNFTDQGVNRWLALLGSKGAKWVTLDMKEASDRVSLELVWELFLDSHLLGYLLACRSTHTRLPNGTIMPLAKFAPMGSALCFPVEALVFWALSVALLVNVGGLTGREARRRVYVYGDDIIVGREDYPILLQHLPSFGLMFNETKCCTEGSFRESCGMDAFKGVDVTPVKFRTVWSSHGTANQLFSYVEYSNALYERGYWQAAAFIQKMVDQTIVKVPTVVDDRPRSYVCYRRLVCDHADRNATFRHRWNKHLHRVEIRATVSHVPLYKRNMPPWEAVFWNLSRDGSPDCSQRPLGPDWVPWSGEAVATQYFPLRRRVTHKRRWMAA